MQMIASDRVKAVVGMGATGLSVARYLAGRGEKFVMFDTRSEPPSLAEFKQSFPGVPVALGELDPEALASADEVVVSPGISLRIPALSKVAASGMPMIGDIELFAREVKAPIVAITGSNGKSTVTTLVGEMCRAAGKNAGVGGNLGTPALDLLSDDRDVYVLELSSFQLETVHRLNAAVAVVLNISPDHMDRYDSMMAYHAAKHRIFLGAQQVVVNRADKLTQPLVADSVKCWSFGLDRPDMNAFGILMKEQEPWLAFQFEALMPETDVAMKGSHNTENALAALALGNAIGLPMDAMLATLRRFRGLPHRCQTVAQKAGVDYINDSKATNVGATIAAVEGLSHNLPLSNSLILIAGGQGKGQDFKPLATALKGRVKLAVLIGEDGRLIGKALKGHVEVVYATSLKAAVAAATEAAVAGDRILLSPACASFDMFSGFEDRGEQFINAVEVI